ncbi:superoxide dismutase [Cu-Zn] [Shouchella clausii]|nr:superoxide dismutase [Cu-Zn] [Shouchella clausii]
MQFRKAVGVCAAAGMLVACGNDQIDLPEEGDSGIAPNNGEQEQADAFAELNDEQGSRIGDVSFFELGDNKTRVDVTVDGLAPGYHGFHVHEEAACDADDNEGPFQSAGGHYHDEDGQHSDHSGDMPPLYVSEDGSAYLSFTTDRFTPANLADERAVIVHADPDNFGHIPERYIAEGEEEGGPDADTEATGDAGDRIACGIVVSEAP